MFDFARRTLKDLKKLLFAVKSKHFLMAFRADARASAAQQALEKELQIQRQSQIIFEEAAKKRDFENRDRVSNFDMLITQDLQAALRESWNVFYDPV